MVTYRTITTNDREYVGERDLRNRVLREPLGLSLSEQDLHGEDEQTHIVAVNDRGEVVGCVLVAFPESGAKIRQLAIEERRRGKGIGSELLRLAEKDAVGRNIRTVKLHARVTARGFFERQGYRAVSEVFTEVTIPHVAMVKDLEAPSAA